VYALDNVNLGGKLLVLAPRTPSGGQ